MPLMTKKSITTAFWSSADALLTDGEFLPFNADALGNATADVRKCIVQNPTILSGYFIDLHANNNTVNGATLQVNVAGTDFSFSSGNQVITVDQATGNFRDTTNTDRIVETGAFNHGYTAGNNTVNIRGASVRVQTL